MADGKYPGLPLEQRIGSIRDGDVTAYGQVVGSKPLTIQPTRKPDMTDDVVTQLRNIINFPPDVDIDWRDAVADALDEIERLRAEVKRKADYAERMDALAEERLIGWNREHALSDQLAQALRWSWELENATHDEVFGVMASAANALAYYDIIRKEKNE